MPTKNSKNPNTKITTIKLEKTIKDRLDGLKEYERETYNDILKKTLNIINITIKNPTAGARILRTIKKKKARKAGTAYHDIPSQTQEE